MEQVVLLDEAARPIGAADKRTVHTNSTPLHLAFSCYLVNQDGNILLTRRALTKLTWPGVWTNSFCGHPAPSESLEAALVRRARDELGASITCITSFLPSFHYRATDASGVVENEVCPVFGARLDSALDPNPEEVAEWAWISPQALRSAIQDAPFAFSPWMRAQLPMVYDLLGTIGTEPPDKGTDG